MYITADVLSELEYGDPRELQAMLGDCTDDELIAWMEIASYEIRNPRSQTL